MSLRNSWLFGKSTPSELEPAAKSCKAFILPHLEYCVPVLVGLSSGLSNKLEFTNQFAIRTLPAQDNSIWRST